MGKQPTVAITGANGFLGSTLAKYFAEKGWKVVGLVRNADKQTVTDAISYREYDITKPVPSKTLHGVDYLVHAAYIKYGRDNPDALDINVTGAKNLLEASRQNNLKKNVFISTMSAHDHAESVYGKQKLAIEKLFDTEQDVNLRCGLIVGNGGIVKQMVDFMRTKHVVPLIGGGNQPLQSVAVSDLCAVIDRCFERPVHGILTIANPTVFSYRSFYETIAKVFSIKIIFIPVPLGVLVGVATIIEALHLPVGFGKDNVLGLKQLQSADNAADLEQLGVELMPLEQALDNVSTR